MNLGKLGLCTAGAIASVALVLAACSSSSTTTGTTGDGGTTSSSSGSSGSSSSCAPSPGTYTVTWTSDPSNSSTCPPGSELSGDENVNESEDTADAGPGCMVTADGCTFTEHCAETADGGVMNTSDTTFTTPSDGASSFTGSITSVTSGGGVDQTCKYTVSGTKK